jgi:two-component system cell cycle sensor histidine kinase PleC
LVLHFGGPHQGSDDGMDVRTTADDEIARRKRLAARERQAAHLREARQKLTLGNGLKPAFAYELTLMFVRNELAAQSTIMLLAAIFSLASMFWAPWTQALLWLSLVIAAKVILLECCRRFQSLRPADVDIRQWRRHLFIAEAINGTAWAGFAMVGMSAAIGGGEEQLFSSHVFIFASLIVVLAIRMTFASTVLPILYVGTIPMTVAVVVRLLLLGDFFYVALAMMAIGVHVYFIFLAKGLHSTALAMLEFRAQKDSLIAELEEATAVSEEARRRAEAANLAKSRFLATMSHELRTPLNAILGFSEVMKEEIMGPLENPTYRDYAKSIHQSGSHLLNLINEILDLSRIEAGRYELSEQPIRLADIVEDCHQLLKLRADAKGLNIEHDLEPGMPHIWADERAMRQICLNLLSNALKFTPRGGSVILRVARTTDGGQLMSVADNGPGIPREEIPKVMQAFGQGSLAHETAEGGTGLGLPIVKKLVELHGGRFVLRSELRRGTEAIAYFPALRVLQALPPLQPLGQERHRAPPAAPPPPPERPHPTGDVSRAPRMRRPANAIVSG